MEELDYTKSASDFIDDVNANLEEMGSEAEVSASMSAGTLVSMLNNVFDDVDDAVELDTDQDAETFVANLNANFGLAEDSGGGGSDTPSEDGIDAFDSTKYGAEMTDTFNKVNAFKETADLIFIVSTDQHHERPETKTVTVGGTSYEVSLNAHGTQNGTEVYDYHSDTLSPLMSNQKEFLKRAAQNNINIDAIVSLGDMFDGYRKNYVVDDMTIMSAKDIVIEYITRIKNKFKALSSEYDVPLIFAVGNHDDDHEISAKAWGNGTDSDLTYKDLYDLYISDTANPDSNHRSETQGGLNYSVDYENAKIRVIVLYCQNPSADPNNPNKGHSTGWTIPTAAKDYFASCMTSLPSDYKAIVMCHIHPADSEGVYGTNDFVNLAAQYSMTNESQGKVICYLSGHSHIDFAYGYPVASFAFCCNLQSSINSPVSGASYREHLDDNDLWQVVAVDTTNKLVRVVRFGGYIGNKTVNNVTFVDLSGMDEIFHYEQIVKSSGTVTLTPTLQNVVEWGIVGTSWRVVNHNNTSQSSYQTVYNASDYASISAAQDNGSCTVTITAQDSTYPQCVTVWARNTDSFEYWVIQIPRTSQSS